MKSGELLSYRPFGIKVTLMEPSRLMRLIATHVEKRKRCVIASLNVHAIRVLADNAEARRLHARPDTYVHIDGMPIVALCRAAGVPAHRRHRITYLDFIWPLTACARAHGWRLFYIGSETAVLAAGLTEIRRRMPGVLIDGHTGFFDASKGSAENAALIRTIRDFQPDVLLVGMGMGRQESWISQNVEELPPVPICTVGALMEYIAGVVGTPPRWMGRWGLEWAYRLAGDPPRFWRRYLLEPLTLIPLLLKGCGSFDDATD